MHSEFTKLGEGIKAFSNALAGETLTQEPTHDEVERMLTEAAARQQRDARKAQEADLLACLGIAALVLAIVFVAALFIFTARP